MHHSQITATQDFDPDVYFKIVADHLLSNFGERALFYADEAIKKMRAMGDRKGFDMWLGVHAHLTRKAADALDQMAPPIAAQASSQMVH